MSFKLEPSAIPDLPEPRPKFEIFVYSPRVEGVHLRFGAVARGGLRWSDRRDDFRTEVLGLVKAQMVKNTVIVPVGAKGGFFCKQLPDPARPRRVDGRGHRLLQDLHLAGCSTSPTTSSTARPSRRADVVRHDGDDSYLVVAADKGTATFSDIANGVAKDYGFWLGDAFACGGSVGYDHKAMGITARGAWVSVQRHFRERGIDCQTEDFTAVGIGDMSGDVFGNGMLCSEHTRLVAAFDHRDIFLDPTPDAATSYAERRRLFDLPRSSWQDYDTSLISEGGGVYSRVAEVDPAQRTQVRAALGIDAAVAAMTPAELMKAILLGAGRPALERRHRHLRQGARRDPRRRRRQGQRRDPVNGARAARPVRRRGRQPRASPSSAGSSTPCSAPAAGGRINTDFIDNSAGVDTSDHEVNIKILLDRVVTDGDLTGKQRNELLAEMTDEVGRAGAARQLRAEPRARQRGRPRAVRCCTCTRTGCAGSSARACSTASSRGCRRTRQVRRRLERGEGLTAPELSVLLAWTKIVLADELLASDLPDDPYLDLDLIALLPDADAASSSAARSRRHPLRREIIVTQVVNDLVNGAGMTFWPRLAERDRRDRRGADPRQLRGPRDLRARCRCARSSGRGTTSSTPRCRPGCGSRCARWSSGPRAGWSPTAGPAGQPGAPSTSSPAPVQAGWRSCPS